MKSYLHAPEVTDDVIQKAFEGTNFGRTDYREFLGYSVLKIACGWHCGHTITTIMIEMDLITPKNKTLTKLGRMFLSDCYDDPLRAATPPAASAPTAMQPLYIAGDGRIRFKENAIVRHLLTSAGKVGVDLNSIAMDDFSDDDRMQLAQLIGYSLGGYGELSYVSDESYNAAVAAAPAPGGDGG